MTGKELKEAIHSTGLSLNVFAKVLGVSRSTLKNKTSSEKVDVVFLQKVIPCLMENNADLQPEMQVTKGPSLTALKKINEMLTKELELMKRLLNQVERERDVLKVIVLNGVDVNTTKQQAKILNIS